MASNGGRARAAGPASGTAFEGDVLVEADSPDRDVVEMRFEARSVTGSFSPVGAGLTQRPAGHARRSEPV
mgnify:CR=1 FL=1